MLTYKIQSTSPNEGAGTHFIVDKDHTQYWKKSTLKFINLELEKMALLLWNRS